jgi:hypothetical protein
VAVLSMSKQEFSRLDVLLRVRSGRLRVTDACVLIGLQRRQVFESPVESPAFPRDKHCFQSPRNRGIAHPASTTLIPVALTGAGRYEPRRDASIP